MWQSLPVTEILTRAVEDASAETRPVPDVVRRARERCGDDGKSNMTLLLRLDTPTSEADAQPASVHVHSDVVQMASGRASGGKAFIFLAVHNVVGRKKNAFVGVSTDPVKTMYLYNHGRTLALTERNKRRGKARAASASFPSGGAILQREANQAAPYWTLASVAGPVMTQRIAEQRSDYWLDGIRGLASKFDRGHTIARLDGLDYYGSDVVHGSSAELMQSLEFNVGREASEAYASLRELHGAIETTQDAASAGPVIAAGDTLSLALGRILEAMTLFDKGVLNDRRDQSYFTPGAPPIVF